MLDLLLFQTPIATLVSSLTCIVLCFACLLSICKDHREATAAHTALLIHHNRKHRSTRLCSNQSQYFLLQSSLKSRDCQLPPGQLPMRNFLLSHRAFNIFSGNHGLLSLFVNAQCLLPIVLQQAVLNFLSPHASSENASPKHSLVPCTLDSHRLYSAIDHFHAAICVPLASLLQPVPRAAYTLKPTRRRRESRRGSH
jgi:hypothetical protein